MLQNERHKMIASSKEADSPTRQEGNTNDTKVGKGPSSSSPWLRLKDPRIVRVSRAFGGKDRHSKVCTIRGLRDRRVRLSVPTAIQLYDLQDRLGLNQPSKVVDWLLNAAKHEIDELPPLPIPPGHFALNPQMVLGTSQEAGASQTNKEGLKISSSVNWEDPAGGLSRSSFWSTDAFWRAKSKEVARETTNEKDIWNKRNEEEKHEGSEGHHGAQVNSSDHNILQRVHHSSFSGLLNNALPYGSYYHLEPSNFPLSHLGSHGFAAHTEELHNFNVVPLTSTLSLSSGSQILVCPPGATQPLFPPHATSSLEIDPRQQVNHFQMLSSGAQNLLPNSLNPPAYSTSQSMIRPFHLSRLLHSQNIGCQLDKEQEFPSK